MTLSEFISERGDAHCAALFSVKARTVASWRRGENFPRAAKAREIVELTKGLVSMEGIYQTRGCGAPATQEQAA